MSPVFKTYPLILTFLALAIVSCEKEEGSDFTGTYTGTVQKNGLGWNGERIDTIFQNVQITVSGKDPQHKVLEVAFSMGSDFHRRENTRTNHTLSSSATFDRRSYTEISAGNFVGDSLVYSYSISSEWGRPDYDLTVRAVKQ